MESKKSIAFVIVVFGLLVLSLTVFRTSDTEKEELIDEGVEIAEDLIE